MDIDPKHKVLIMKALPWAALCIVILAIALVLI